MKAAGYITKIAPFGKKKFMTQYILGKENFESVESWKEWLKVNYPEGRKQIYSSSLCCNPPIHCYEAFVDGVKVSEYRIRAIQNNSW